MAEYEDPILAEMKEKEAELKKAKAELKEARSGKDKASLAAKLMAVAEVLLTKPGTQEEQLAQVSEAAEYSDEAAKAFGEAGDKVKQAETLKKVADIHFMEQEFGLAEKSATAAAGAFQELGDKKNTAACLEAVASALWYKGQYQDPLAKLEEAKAIYKELGDNKAVATVVLHVSQLHLWFNENDVALESANEALRLFRAADEPSGEAASLKQIADSNFALLQKEAEDGPELEEGDEPNTAQDPGYKDCLKSCKDAMKIYLKLKDDTGRAATLLTMAKVCMALRQGYPAVDHATRAKSVYTALGDQDGYFQALFISAQANFVAGEAAMAMRFASEAQEICYMQGNAEMMKEVKGFIDWIRQAIWKRDTKKPTGKKLGLNMMVFKM